MSVRRFALVAAVTAVAGGCQEEKLGQPCGIDSPPTPVPASDDSTPIDGENPVVEVVGMETDGACESFQCITHGGLAPYCSRRCSLDAPEAKQRGCTADANCSGAPFSSTYAGRCVNDKCVCEEDSDCKAALHCIDGKCMDDDCPVGFWCKRLHEVGESSDHLFCVFRDGCKGNSECEALGSIECRQLGCYDACLADDVTCDFHRLTCEPVDELRCQCCDSQESCVDADLACVGECTSDWRGAVRRTGVCMPKEFYP